MPRCEATVATPGRATFGEQCSRNAVKGTLRCERHGGVDQAKERGIDPGPRVGRFRQQCTASSTRSGERCKKWAINGGFVCRTHGGHLPNVQAGARKRLLDLLPLGVQRLQTILESPETSDSDALRAVAMLMDRTGLGPQSEVSVEVKPWQKLYGDGAVDGGIFRKVDPSEIAPPVRYAVEEPVLDAEIIDEPVVADRDVEALGEPSAAVTPIRVGSANPPRGSRMYVPSASRRR